MNAVLQKILIVDDDDRNIFALKAVLTAKGYNCVAASSAEAALDMLQKEKNIGAALVDMMMPGMDGYEFMQLVKKGNALSHVPLVAVTAQAMPGDKEKCLAAGADGYISKPIDIDKLLAVLDGLVKQGS